MKVQDFAYQTSVRTMELLEEMHHYNIPEELRRKVSKQILKEINAIIKKAS